MKDIDEITGDVLDAAFKLHTDLGPGLLESVYEAILAAKLAANGYRVDRQRPVNIEYDGLCFDNAFRIDLLIDERLIVEIKSVERLTPVHSKQLLTYLRLTKQPVGLLINFAGATLKEGVRRIVNDHGPSASPRESTFFSIDWRNHVRPNRHDRIGDRRLGRNWVGDRQIARRAGCQGGAVGDTGRGTDRAGAGDRAWRAAGAVQSR